MVIHGEDSLNEGTEDEGLVDDDEPTDEQLIATGELDEESAEAERIEQPGMQLAVEKTTAVTVTEETKLSIRKQVRQRLLEGATREQLLAEGYNKSTISTVASEVKKELGSQRPVGKALMQTKSGAPIFAKGSPPEAIIEGLEMPDVANGGGQSFMMGTKFGMSLLVLATRITQELSAIGIQQTKPLIDAAREMRTGEEAAAKNAAGEAAMEAAGLVRDSMMPLLASLNKGSGGTSNDPMRQMMAKQFEPIITQVMQSMLGGLLPGIKQPQLTDSNTNKGTGTGWAHTEE